MTALQAKTYIVKSVTITTDNKYIITGCRDNAVRIFKLQVKTHVTCFACFTNLNRTKLS